MPVTDPVTTSDVCQLTQFLDALFADEDLIEIRPIETWLEGNGKKASRVLTGERRWVTKAEIIENVDQLTVLTQVPHFANIFFGTCPRRKRGDGKAGDICTVRVLWIDIDHRRPDEVLYRVRELGLPEPSIVVASGHGTHLYWILEYAVDVDGMPQREAVETVLNR